MNIRKMIKKVMSRMSKNPSLYERYKHRYNMILRAVDSCIIRGDDGFWRVGNHILMEDRPNIPLIAHELMNIHSDKVLVDHQALYECLAHCVCWSFEGEKTKLFSLEFNDALLNIGVKTVDTAATSMSFRWQFAMEFSNAYLAQIDEQQV